MVGYFQDIRIRKIARNHIRRGVACEKNGCSSVLNMEHQRIIIRRRCADSCCWGVNLQRSFSGELQAVACGERDNLAAEAAGVLQGFYHGIRRFIGVPVGGNINAPGRLYLKQVHQPARVIVMHMGEKDGFQRVVHRAEIVGYRRIAVAGIKEIKLSLRAQHCAVGMACVKEYNGAAEGCEHGTAF